MVTPVVQARRLMRAGRFAEALDVLAYASLSLGRHEDANALYRRIVQLAPESPRFWYNLASSERSFGRLAQAEAACDRAIGLDPQQYPSYLLRSELQVQTAERNHVAELKAQLARSGLEDRARMFLGYALAKELDDLRRFDEAFRWFADAAGARRRHLSYDVAVDEEKMRRIAAAFPRRAFPRRALTRPALRGLSRRCIFIVGLPRSGTTLLERVLTGLPRVRSNGETDNFARALMAATPAGNGDVFARAAAADPARVAAGYMGLADLGTGDHSVIEKLPMNYLYLGAIHRALPDAKILLVRRSPLDSCFAMYRTLFGEAYPFSYDLDDLARYYSAYERLLNHWRGILEGDLHEVSYDDFVANPAAIGTRVAAHCGLTWEAAAIEVHKNASVSLTASAAQVRQPIHGSSCGRWRYYRRHLETLIAALRRYGVALPDA